MIMIDLVGKNYAERESKSNRQKSACCGGGGGGGSISAVG